MGCESILSIDVGTTTIKAGVIDCKSLKTLSKAERRTPIKFPKPGWAEQDPDELWSVIADVASEAVGGSRVKVDGISTSTYLAGVVLLGEKGEALSPIIVWLDERAAGHPRELFRGFLKVKGYNLLRLAEMLWLAGGAPSKTGKDPLSKISWLRENEADAFRRSSTIGTFKTWILSKLAGANAVSPDDAHLTWLVDARGGKVEWSPRLLRRYQIPPEKMPRILEPWKVAGRLSRKASSEMGLESGLPVFTGTGDIAAAALGSGAVGEGEYHLYIGTSDWIGVHSRRRLLDVTHYIGSLASGLPSKYLVIAEHEVAGLMLEYVASLLGLKVEEALAEAATIPPGSEGLLATPWLFGERSPIDEPEARGVIIGLSPRHSKGHLVRAAMESVALNIAWTMEYFVKLAGKPKVVRGVGGGFQSKLWAEIVASSIGYPVEVVEEPREASLKGAAIVAAAPLEGVDLEVKAKMVRVKTIVKPNPKAMKVYREALKAYKRIYPSLKGIFQLLPSFRTPGGDRS